MLAAVRVFSLSLPPRVDGEIDVFGQHQPTKTTTFFWPSSTLSSSRRLSLSCPCRTLRLPFQIAASGWREKTHSLPSPLLSRVLYLSTCVCIHTVLLLTWRHAPMNRSFTQSFVLHSCTTLTFLPFLLPSFFLSFFFSPPVSVSHCAQRTLRRQEGNT